MADSLKQTAHRAGALYFIFMIFGIIGEFVIPSFIVSGDPAATARNISANEFVFRLGLLNDTFTLVMFIYLVVLLYKLFREVDLYQSIVMVLLVTVGVSASFANVYHKFDALLFVAGGDTLSSFSQPQLEALTHTLIRGHGRCGAIPIAFWGLWLFPFGFLVARSGFLPRILGYLLMIAGVGYLATSIVAIGFPDYRSMVNNIVMPLYIGEVPIIFYLLIKGIRAQDPPALTPKM